MKIYKNSYRDHWISPYTILKTVCFWERDEDVFYHHEERPDAPYQRWVERLTPVCYAVQRILDLVHPKIDYVRIDPWDTWSMDHTLADVILPMLKQLQETKHGAPHVDDRDVPKELRSTSAPPKANEWDTDELWFARWDWVLAEMIFAFEHKVDNSWEEQFRSGEFDRRSVACDWDEAGKPTMYSWEPGPNHTYEYDYQAAKKVHDRMQRGFELFGKYFQNLWD
jgi:hypothetical protein